MTLGRAVSRRRLALVPPSFDIPITQEVAWLALGVSTIRAMTRVEQTNTDGAGCARDSKSLEWKRLWQGYSETPIRWEVPMGEELLDNGENRRDTPSRNQEPKRLSFETRLSTSIERGCKPGSDSSWWRADMEAFFDVRTTVPWLLPLSVQDQAYQLVTAIQNVCNFLMATPDILWAQERLFDPPGAGSQPQETNVTWKIPITYVRHFPSEISGVQTVEILLSLEKVLFPCGMRRWYVSGLPVVEGILYCWLYSLASRAVSSGVSLTEPKPLSHTNRARKLIRIVGSHSGRDAPPENGAHLLKKWLGNKILTLAVLPSRDPSPWPLPDEPRRPKSMLPWIGVFLAGSSRYVLSDQKKASHSNVFVRRLVLFYVSSLKALSTTRSRQAL